MDKFYKNPKIQIHFKCMIKTMPGERVFVTGDHPELGSWDPKKGKLLNFFDDYWEGYISLVSDAKRIEYKFVIIYDNGNVRWEEGENRVIDSDQKKNFYLGTFLFIPNR